MHGRWRGEAGVPVCIEVLSLQWGEFPAIPSAAVSFKRFGM